jgi:hypothetical protein
MARLYPSGSARLAPAVGGLRGSHQRVAQLTQFGYRGPFVQRRGNVLGRASHLVDAVGQVGGLVSGQHDRVWRHQRTFCAVDRGPLLVGPLPARLPAVLAATSQPVVADVAAAPAARLRADATAHGADFSRGYTGIPVSWNVESSYAATLGTLQTAPSVVQDVSC